VMRERGGGGRERERERGEGARRTCGTVNTLLL
jgi:hypothetical protein